MYIQYIEQCNIYIKYRELCTTPTQYIVTLVHSMQLISRNIYTPTVYLLYIYYKMISKLIPSRLLKQKPSSTDVYILLLP